MRLSACFALVALLAASAAVPSATAQTPFAGLALSPGAVASVVTVRPGDAVYSRFGHTGVRIRDEALGIDILYNYGTFRFDRWFLARFAYGAMDYELSAAPAALAIEGYRVDEDRGVVEQTLRASPAQVQALFDALEDNLRPENATYRYDFLFDNCATRPRDIVGKAFGGALVWPGPRPSGATFRDLIRLYARDAPGLSFVMDMGIGTPVDRAAPFRDATFLPDTLAAYLAGARVRTPGGAFVPLVARTETLVTASAARPAPATFDWALALACAIFAAVAFVTLRDAAQRRVRRRIRLDRAVFCIAGITGVVLAFLAFVSVHRVTAPNAALLWASPVHLWLAWAKTGNRMARRYAALAAALAFAGAAVGAVGVQDIPAAAVPLALAVALRAIVRAWPPTARG